VTLPWVDGAGLLGNRLLIPSVSRIVRRVGRPVRRLHYSPGNAGMPGER